MARPETRAPASLGADWLLAGLLLVAVAVALGGLNSVLTGIDWWIQSALVAGVVLLAGAVVRSFARHRLWGTLAAALAAFGIITLLFAPAKAVFGVIPTAGTFDDLGKLFQDGLDSIATQVLPADAVPGVMYLVCLGVAAIAFVMDALAFALRSPALTGLPLLVLLLVPTFVIPGITDALFFTLTAAAWLAILLVRARPGGRRAAVGIGVGALVIALVVPGLLPVPDAAEAGAGKDAAFAAGVNPIINLGDDLRRGDERLAITYTTTHAGGEYLRLAALDDFGGQAWTPTTSQVEPDNTVSAIGPVPGLGPTVAVADVTSKVTVANILSRWLPVPYAPTKVTGLVGEWTWDADALAVRTTKSNARNQVYEVTSVEPTPSVEELTAAGSASADAGLERYLQLPPGLPDVVASTALQVVGDATTDYEKAVRLQDYFTGGTFTYSESAPVKQGYDGSGASVLAEFLRVKSGYCVHFASAMASMARTLGIPSRVAVGFTPGTAVAVEGSDVPEYRVTTHDLHAWPELYFSGIGWVRFEPTPGRGVAPAFAPLTKDDPATPDVDESKPQPVASSPAPTTAPTSTALPTEAPVVADPTSGPTAAAAAPSPLVVIVPVLLLLALPFILRTGRRQRRFARLGRGSALAGWDELRDTADDLGLKTDEGHTPRQLARDLDAHLDDDGAAALARLRAALEGEAFAGQPGSAEPGDLRAVLRALRRDAGLARRIAAAALPRSLFAAWLPQPVVVDE